MHIFKTLFLVGSVSLCFGEQSISDLLSTYKIESQESKISKKESAGFVDTYTRDDIERMNARTLMDILKLFTIPNISRTSDGRAFFTKPTNKLMPNSSTRLFINDHDMTSAGYGSDAMMWADMSLEFVDHIVVYKTSSSIEFGNEPGTVIIKLYTKSPETEQGGKIRVDFDDKQSTSLSSYYAQTVNDDFSYLLYFNTDNIKREKYYNAGYELNSDNKSQNIFVDITYKKWRLELAHFKKENNDFLGIGQAYTPTGEGDANNHDYIHLSRTFSNDLKVQLSYDYIDIDVNHYDENGISAGALGLVNDYRETTEDKILSATVEKVFHFSNNRLFVGGYYKHKYSHLEGYYDNFTNHHSNTLNLFSIYAENSYSFDDTTMLVASLKGDFYRFDKEIKSQNEYIARVGFIKNIDNFQIKTFYTKTYYAVPMAALYSGDANAPQITNANLDYPNPTLISLGVKYKNDKHEVDLRAAMIEVDNRVIYKPTAGFVNIDNIKYDQYEFKYTYKIAKFDKISLDVYSGKNGENLEMSPKYGANLLMFNTFGKFDFYNQLLYRSSYEAYEVDVGASYDFTSSLKYNHSDDLSFGVKGENIFNSGFEQAYSGYDKSIQVFDRKLWINMEYLF